MPKIAKGFIKQFSRKWGSKFLGAGNFGDVPYIQNLYITFCCALWAVEKDVKIFSNSTSGLELIFL